MDEIRRRLALIEAQLGGRSLHARLIDAAGLFFPAVGLMAGIVAQNAAMARFGPADSSARLRPEFVLPLLASAALCLAMVCTHRRLRPAVAAWGALLCFAGLGAVRLAVFTAVGNGDIRRFVTDERVLATIRGRILTPPARIRNDWCFAELAFADPSTVFYLKLDGIHTDRGWIDVSGTLRVQVDEPTPGLSAGDTIVAYCWLYRFGGPTNPGQFDLATHLARKNIHVGASVPSGDAIKGYRSDSRHLLGRLQAKVSQAASEALLSGPVALEDPHGLAAALLLGDRDRIDRRTYEAFRRTGLLHFVSLSGMHLGIFAGLVWRLGRTAGLMKPGRAIVCAIATAAFLLAVPARAPTIRAAIIVWVFCVAIVARRRTGAFNCLCLAAIVLLLVRPTHVFEAGWQLSFAAVAGILALTDPIEGFIHDLTHDQFRRKGASGSLAAYAVRRIGGGAIRLFAAGLGAWIGGAGILLYHFWTIAPLAGFWTVLVFPLVAMILTAGFLKIVLFFLLPTLAGLLGTLLAVATDLLVRIVTLLSHLNVNTLLVGRVPIGLVAAYYALVLFARFGRTRRPLPKRALCLATGILLIAWIGVAKWGRTHRDRLQMTCLDVGHGQAIVVQLPGTETILFDAGSIYQRDVGSRIVRPFLNWMGIANLHAVVLSHGDIDHVNGVPEILDGCRVRHVYGGRSLLARPPTDPTTELLIRSLRKRGREIEPLPISLGSGDATIQLLWPPDEPAVADHLSDNDRSLVCLIEFAGVKILLCSDIEQYAQQQILVRYPDLTADIVVVPHHGSTRTLDDAFLRRISPSVQIRSCNRKQYTQTGHLTEEEDVTKFSTASNGAITVCVESDGMVSTTGYIHP
ncbi:DNA internalization-related competence protein ComEC/Rec2 [Anaerobaca lacustris]|uniref:DNA internalization-related competence protein ComEC/Rec2 n=1 Tax=Anaerobaca lacustris TaxID=3044600 RepID=A0AAW6U2E4_9BACT|nr:DNA internalization-related competence protein ComEC/Rec2 [Sedimentisphaerales bacterium M17dextr]